MPGKRDYAYGKKHCILILQSEFEIDLISRSAILTGQSILNFELRECSATKDDYEHITLEMLVNQHREELHRLYDSAFSHISNIFMPDFNRFVECVLSSDFSCFKPGEKMIWGTSLPLKGLIAHLHTYMIGGIDSRWIDRAAASISTNADECRKRTTSLIR